MSITFINNPKLSIFLPVFYVAWEDGILTKEEFKTLNSFINNQEWLTKAEKDFLKSKIDTQSPPVRSELFRWKEKIDKAIQGTPKLANLTELGLLIANTERTAYTVEDSKKIAPAFAKLESDLGIMSRETISGFRKNRDTITHNHKTIESFNIAKMTAFLDGNQAAIINKVKQIISSPEFAFEDTSDIIAFREKVLQWSQILANEGLGSYAYPKAQGGKDDVESYFTIMETLSYHDLSLVIKFGVQFGLWGMSILS